MNQQTNDREAAPIAGTVSQSELIAALEAWQPIDTAPKGGGAECVTDPNWVEPPLLLLLFADGNQAVCHWDWYYAKGGNGYKCGISAWVEPVSGEQIALYYDEPTHWRPRPTPPVYPLTYKINRVVTQGEENGRRM